MLRSLPSKALIYDMTHDNPSPVDQWNSRAVLPLVCALAMGNVAIGTTRGLDELIPKNMSVIDERRPYSVSDASGLPTLQDVKALETDEVELVCPAHAHKVVAVGTFNDWKGEEYKLAPAGPGMWKGSFRLPIGTHQYKFLVDGRDWLLGPGDKVRDKDGHLNNVLVVDYKRSTGVQAGLEMQVYENLYAVRRVSNELHSVLGTLPTTFNAQSDVRLPSLCRVTSS
jgi:hypothetical protein